MRKTKKFPHKKVISVWLALCMGISVLCVGCGSVAAEDEEVIELHEPQTGEASIMNTEKVARRNLYRTQVYSGVVFPYVEAYSYETGQKFGSYGAVLGETVRQGTPLVSMDTQDISKKIESMEEKLRSLTETYEKFKEKTENELVKLREELENIQDILDNLEEEEPAEYVAGAGGISMANPAYVSWQKDFTKWEGQYNNKELSIERKTEALRQKTELYTLDNQYYSGQLKKLKEEESAGTLTSQIEGKIVAMGLYTPGASIRANVPVSVVGDMEKKFIKCSKVPELNRLRAMEIYAVAGGKRYEVAYTECDDEDYSLFALLDGQEAEIGDVAALVLVMDAREQVPTVSADSIHKDGLQQYVYVLENGRSVSKMIQSGMSDGVYTEILSGVEIGEQVMIPQGLKAGANTAILKKETFEIAYGGSGNLVYPVRTVVSNPIKKGTVYFQEYTVKERQYVEKGDVIATIRVEGDGVELARKETSLKRAKERLADLIAQEEEDNGETITQRQEEIKELEEEIASIKTDYGTTEIRATASGRVLATAEYYTGDVVKSGNPLVAIADENVTFLSVTNESGYLHYGDVVEITYQDTEGKERTAEGTVATFGLAMGGVLASKEMLVALPGGKLEDVQTAKETANGSYVSVRIGVSAVLDVVNHVVTVPKRAVTEIEGNTYVNVLTEDGTVMPVSFVAGGMNRESYWVIEGLTEGMKICWE